MVSEVILKNEDKKETPIWIIMSIVIVGALMSIIDGSIVNVALPTISGNLGASSEEISSITTSYILANVIIMPLNGYLTSLLGRKWYYTISLALFTLASFLCGISWNIGSLVIFRVIQGLGGGALIPTAQSILFETFPKEKHGQAMAAFGLAVMAGPAIGPTLGGWLVDVYGWRSIFNINVIPGIVVTFLTLLFIKNPAYLKKVEGKFDYLGLTSMIIGISSLQYVLEKGQDHEWFESNIITTLTIVSILSIAFFIFWELKVKNPIVDLSVFKDKNFTIGNIVGIVTGFGLYGLNLILPLFLSSILGYNAFDTGMAVLPGALATAFGMVIIGRLADRFDPRILIGFGLSAFALSGFMLATLTTLSGYWDFFSARIVQGLSLAFLFVPLSKITMNQIPISKMSGATGIYSLIRQLGGSIGIAILTTLLTYYSKLEYAHLSDYVNVGNQLALDKLNLLRNAMISKGFYYDLANQKALMMLKGMTQKQALMIAYDKLFTLASIVFICSIPLLLLFNNKKKKTSGNNEVHLVME